MEDVSQETQAKEAQPKTEGSVEKDEKTEEEHPTVTESSSMIEKAEKLAERMEKANEAHEKLTARDEAVAARVKLGGRAIRGDPIRTPEEEEKVKIEEEAKAALERFKR